MTAGTADAVATDLYAVLGVEPTASAKEITRAYRRLARELHPDARAGSGDAAADQRFADVAAAYEVLGDPARRSEYDARRAAAARRAAGRAGADGVRIRVHRRGDDAPPGDVLQDVLGGVAVEDLLAAAAGRSRASGWPRRPRPGRDVQARVRLGFADAVRGASVEVPTAGASPQGVQARIPPGVEDGQTLRLRGRGEPGTDGGPPGDLLVQVAVDPHPVLRREGRHLTVALPVTFAEAALGADVAVPTLDGPVTVRVPPGTASGTTLRVRGRGVPGDGRHEPGDLLVTVQVHVPQHLTPAQRAAVEQLASVLPEDPRRSFAV